MCLLASCIPISMCLFPISMCLLASCILQKKYIITGRHKNVVRKCFVNESQIMYMMQMQFLFARTIGYQLVISRKKMQNYCQILWITMLVSSDILLKVHMDTLTHRWLLLKSFNQNDSSALPENCNVYYNLNIIFVLCLYQKNPSTSYHLRSPIAKKKTIFLKKSYHLRSPIAKKKTIFV